MKQKQILDILNSGGAIINNTLRNPDNSTHKGKVQDRQIKAIEDKLTKTTGYDGTRTWKKQ